MSPHVNQKVAPKISYRLDEESGLVVLTAISKTLIGEELVQVEDWPARAPQSRSTLSQLQGIAESGEAGPDGRLLVELGKSEIRLHPQIVATLDGAAAAVLNLPPATTLALDLQSAGLVTDAGFLVRSRWMRPGGGVVRAEVRGAVLKYDGIQRRIPDPLFAIWNAARVLSSQTSESDRFGALSALQDLLPEQARTAFQANGYLGETRIHYASAFSLRLGRADPFDFDPVLFGPASVRRADEDASIDEDDSILPPRAQRVFAEDRFRRSREVKPAYVLRDGDYVYIDPALRPALQEVRTLQSAPQAERRAFVTNPRRVLRQRLGDEIADQTGVDTLFLETEQFSARVAGVDIWTKPVLPWLKQAPNSWLPEKFGLRIGDQYVELAPEVVVPLADAVEAAIERNEGVARVDDIEVPASHQTREALNELRPFVEARAGHGVEEPDSEFAREFKERTKDRYFLIVRENFDEVAFAPFEPADTEAPLDFAIPSRVGTTLKPHQVDGLKWLVEAATRHRSGALLADDMGLGKTLQAIAFMAWLQDQAAAGKRSKAPILVVAPTGLLANWRSEIERHLLSPQLGEIVLAFGGSLKALREEDAFAGRDIVSGRSALQAESWRSAGVVLTTYETLRDYHISFAKSPFELVVFDEMQKLKNPTSQLTRVAKTLNARFVLGMTGTPVENRLHDLWSILDVIAPGFLGSSKDFDKRYASTDATALKALRSSLADRHEGMPPYMLRRMKADHLPGLPEKLVHAKQIQMPPIQAQAYEAVVRRAVAGKAGFSKSDGMLQVLHAMRGVSLHPVDPDDAPADLEVYAAQSARLSWTLEILKEIQDKREKALVFVESLAMQAKLATLIQTRFGLRHPPPRIHGGVPGPKRQEFVDRFQQRPGEFDVMLLSPKAGGVGLTITAANHVIHLSRWWNPAVEDQSTDRVYRIGQTRPVHVYLPLAVHGDPTIGPSSFDVRLDSLLERKRALSRDMLIPPEANDADVGALFEEVSTFSKETNVDAPDEVGDAPSHAPDAASVEGSSTAPARENANPPPRAVLSLQTAPASLQPRVWRCGPRQQRPLPEILKLFEGAKIRHLEISDPYSIADPEARRSQVEFVKALIGSAQAVEQVTIEYKPPWTDEGETESDQRRDIGSRWGALLGSSAANIRLTLKARRKTRERDFHDRFVFFNCVRAGGSIARHELQLGKGLISLMDDKHECSITYVPPDLRQDL
jgi:hypothetical protein